MDLDITIGNRSEATGRFNFVRSANGDVSFDTTEAHSVITAVFERRNGYWADPNGGSLLYQLSSLTSRTPSQSQAIVLDALQRLETLGLIINVVVTSTVGNSGIGGGALGITVAWSTPINQQQTVQL